MAASKAKINLLNQPAEIRDQIWDLVLDFKGYGAKGEETERGWTYNVNRDWPYDIKHDVSPYHAIKLDHESMPKLPSICNTSRQIREETMPMCKSFNNHRTPSDTCEARADCI